MIKIIKTISPKTSYIVWQEVFENGNITKDSIIQIWKTPYSDLLELATLSGHKVLLSSCWYLDILHQSPDWPKYYKCDPHDFPGKY